MEIKSFNETIKAYLDDMAKKDKQFAVTYAKKNKSIEECCKYIMGEVKKNRNGQNCVALSDDVVYGMAVHYYDEDDIKVEGNVSDVKVSTSVEPVAEEAEEKPKKATCTKKPKAEVEADPNIPEPLDIPLF